MGAYDKYLDVDPNKSTEELEKQLEILRIMPSYDHPTITNDDIANSREQIERLLENRKTEE